MDVKLKAVKCMLVSIAMAGFAVPAFEMEKVTIPLTHPANGSVLHLSEPQQLLVSGFNQYERWLTAVDLQHYHTLALPIPDTAQYFTKAKLAGYSAEQLVFLTENGIEHYQQFTEADGRVVASFKPLLQASSLFRTVDSARLRQRPFAIALGSELSDFIVPDFKAMHLYRQNSDGSFRHYALPVTARVQTWNNNRAEYSARQHYIVDVNQDGLADLLFVQNGRIEVFLQQTDGSFNTAPYIPNWPLTLSTEQQQDQRSDAGRSYSGQSITTLEELTDLDGDGIPDIVLNTEHIADALERSSRFQVFFGRKTEQGLMFSEQADTEIKVDSVPTEVVIADFNGDGRKDFYIPTTKIGVGTIVRVLLRGSANLDVDFYLLAANRTYPAKADFRQQAKIDVSISNLRFDMPLFQLVDVTGDGRKSLVLGEGSNELRFFAPDKQRLFSRKSDTVTLALPRDASKVRVMDLNGDGKEDLILPFDSLDAAGQQNQLQLLLSE